MLFRSEEVSSPKPGRKAAKANLGLQLGVQSTPIGNTAMRRIMNTANTIAPSFSGMAKQANKVGRQMESIGRKALCDVRESLVQENSLIGQTNPSMLNCETDTCYNNPIYNTDSTPFQAGTVAISTMVENNTRDKKIVAVHIASKLCPLGTRLRNQGQHVQCPGHVGCTANLKESDSIGNEQEYTKTMGNELRQSGVFIANITADGDSRGHAGVSKTQPHKVGHLKDLRHLGNSMRRAINRAPFSKNMFVGKNKPNLKNRFSHAVKSRCMAELHQSHASHNGNLQAIKQAMPDVVNAIIHCFNGYCGESCQKFSYVCGGTRKTKPWLPNHSHIRMTATDKQHLTKCINMVLGQDSLNTTKLLTTTQKCEAVNRAYISVNPKSGNFARNHFGRTYGKIMALNYGTADSILMKTEMTGANITKRSKVITQLIASDKTYRSVRTPASIQRRKAARAARRARNYQVHAEIHYAKGLTDPTPVF